MVSLSYTINHIRSDAIYKHSKKITHMVKL
nr:MAG TPA: hypothetical protein [Caudoviricetes sp.]